MTTLIVPWEPTTARLKPTMETHHQPRVIGFDTEAELIEWIKSNSAGYSKKTFRALRYQPLSIQTELSVSYTHLTLPTKRIV